MSQGGRSFFSKPEKDDEACYQVIGGETVELCGRPQDRSAFSASGQSALPCGLHHDADLDPNQNGLRSGGMTPRLSGSQVTTVLPYLSDSAGGIEREPLEEKEASSSRLAATLMDAMIPFHSSPRLIRSFGSF